LELKIKVNVAYNDFVEINLKMLLMIDLTSSSKGAMLYNWVVGQEV